MGGFSRPSRLAITAGVFLVLLLPSFWLAWQNRDMPHFSYLHDDSVYYVTAKSIAEGSGLVIGSLPSRAVETKFPPALPYYHALSWLIEPRFPENLRVALWLQWGWLPVFLVLCRMLWQMWGFSDWKCWALTAFAALNVFVFFGSVTILTELPFLSFALGSFLLAQKARTRFEQQKSWIWWVVLAGVCAAGAFLFRSIGVFLLFGVPGALLLKRTPGIAAGSLARRFRMALLYATPLLCAFAAWTLFVKTHPSAGPAGEIYYTSYLGYHLGGFLLEDVPMLVWKNLDGVTMSMGVILLPAQGTFFLLPVVVRAAAIMAGVGVWRMVRRGEGADYAIFGSVYLLSLLGWHQPNERMILPVLPLLMAGACEEIGHLGRLTAKAFQHSKREQRVAAWVMSLLIGLFVFWMAESHYERMFLDIPNLMEGERRHVQSEQAAFAWAKQNLPEGAGVLTGQDPFFFLYTGRHAVRPLVPLRHWYRDDTAEAVFALYGRIDEYARENRLDYVYWGTRTPLPSSDMMERVTHSVLQNSGLEPLAQMPEGVMFRVKPRTANAMGRSQTPRIR